MRRAPRAGCPSCFNRPSSVRLHLQPFRRLYGCRAATPARPGHHRTQHHLASALLYCLLRRANYATSNPSDPTDTAALITGNGQLIWVWAGAWLTAAALRIADVANRHTRHGLSAAVGITATWGFAHLVGAAAAATTGSDSRDWVTALAYHTPAGMVFGLLLKVTALHDMANPAASQ